ncbi:MAG TPA: cytochrome C oxidase subunit IV family protein [Blastocatellia bacterium]|nr:cytochrome C oxidase subunit IV family protein [Blastocatellia bacterium]
MTETHPTIRYRLYWVIWGALLALTLLMMVSGSVTVPKGILVGILLVGMLVKASLIGGYFMHLRFERLALVISVAAGLLLTAGVLFFLIAPDGLRVLNSTAR